MDIQWFKENPLRCWLGLLLILLMFSLYFALQKPVSIVVDGQTIQKKVFFSSSVATLLAKEKIILGERDRIEPDLGSKITKNMVVKIDRAFPVFVKADGNTQELLTPPITVQAAVSLAGIQLNEPDIISADLSDLVTPRQEIDITRVSEATIEEQQEVPYYVERTVDESLERGLSRTLHPGKNGLALNTIKVTYHDNMEVKRVVVESKIIKEPVNRVVAMGNITSVSRGGIRMEFREAKYMEASAYTYTGNNTATGKPPAVGLVAVDPSVIPLGSRLYVEGYGYAQAADTGGSIKGDRIDLFMEEANQCIKWGRRMVKVYILQ